MPVISSLAASWNSGPSSFSTCVLSQRSRRALRDLARRAGQLLVGDDAQARLEHLLAGDELADRLAEPADRAIGGEHDLLVGRLREPRGARVDLARQRLLGGAGQRLGLRAGRRGRRREHEAVEPADHVALDHHLAGLADVGLERRVLAQAPHQHAGAAIDETLGQPLVQRIGQPVLDRARDLLPMLGIGQPVRTVGREGPGPDMGDAVRERVDVAVGVVGLRHLARRTSRSAACPPASGSRRA